MEPFLKIEVANPVQPEIRVEVEFFVNSGAICSVAPTKIFDELGIKPLSEEEFRLANGETVTRKKGGMLFKYGERIGVADVIFGEPGDSNLLRAFTLEALRVGT